MRKQYRILGTEDGMSQDVINKFAKEGFRIIFVVTKGEWHYPVVYMERDVDETSEPFSEKEQRADEH